MPKDKYPSIFSPQMAIIVFIILQIFFATRAVLKTGEYLTIILRNRAEYRLERKGLVNLISNGTVVTFNTYEATYVAGYLLPTDDRYREHHVHIWIVLQFVA